MALLCAMQFSTVTFRMVTLLTWVITYSAAPNVAVLSLKDVFSTRTSFTSTVCPKSYVSSRVEG